MMIGSPICSTHLHRLVERVGDAAGRHGQADLDHRLLELVAVLGGGDRLGVGADHLGRAGHADDAALEQLPSPC